MKKKKKYVYYEPGLLDIYETEEIKEMQFRRREDYRKRNERQVMITAKAPQQLQNMSRNGQAYLVDNDPTLINFEGSNDVIRVKPEWIQLENKQTMENKVMQITRSELKKMIQEAIYKDPGLETKGLSKEEAKKVANTWQAWLKQFNNIANLLTSKSGYWYVGSSQSAIAEKIEKMDPDNLKEFRIKVANLVKMSRVAEKAMDAVKKEANVLIASLDK